MRRIVLAGAAAVGVAVAGCAGNQAPAAPAGGAAVRPDRGMPRAAVAMAAVQAGRYARGGVVAPDGRVLYVADAEDARTRAYDLETRKPTDLFGGALDHVKDLQPLGVPSLSDDGKRVAFQVKGKRNADAVAAYDLPSGKRLAYREIEHNLQGFALAPTGDVLAVATAALARAGLGKWSRENHSVYLYPLDRDAAPTHLSFGGNNVLVRAMAFSPDGKTLAVASDKLRVIDVATGKVTREIDGAAESLSVSADGKYLAGGSLGAVLCWDLASGREVTLAGAEGLRGPVAFLAAGPVIACAREVPQVNDRAFHEVVFYDVEAGKVVAETGVRQLPLARLTVGGKGRVTASFERGLVLVWGE